MDRRHFLKASGIATTGLLISSCSTISRKANDQMYLGAIGCGRMGRSDINGMLAVADKQNAIFVAVCDVDDKRAADAKKMIEEFYAQKGITHRIRTYSSYKKLLKTRSIDAVVISTPDHTHGAIAIDAAYAKKDIYLQKPLTYTLEEGKQLIHAVRSNGCILQTGTQQRSSIYFRRVCELVRNHKIGDLKSVEVVIPMDKGSASFVEMPVPQNLDYRAWLGTAPVVPYTEAGVHPQADYSRPGWMQIGSYGHGMITNWGAHMMDIAQWGIGSELSAPTKIEASAVFDEDRGIFNVHRKFEAYNEYANGIKLHFRTMQKGEKISPGVKFIGTGGWARCTRGGFSAHDRDLLRWEAGDDEVKLKVSTNHYGNFMSAVRERVDPITNVEVGHRSNSLCLINLIAAKLNRPLQWDPDKEEFLNDSQANAFLKDMRLNA